MEAQYPRKEKINKAQVKMKNVWAMQWKMTTPTHTHTHTHAKKNGII